MHRPTAQDFLVELLESLDDLPPDLSRRLADVLEKDGADRTQAIRRLFEELAGD